MKVLLAEDDPSVASFVIKGLEGERFVVDWTPKGDQATFWGRVNSYDAAILDINLTGEVTGLEVCRKIREKGQEFPIIMLSVIHDLGTKINTLNAGADDYLTKPFSMAELAARIRALLRREKHITGPVLKAADLTLDITARTVTRANQHITLNRKEFSLLELLMRNQGATMTRNMILEHVWETNVDPLTNTVDVHIRFLRRKIDDGHARKLIKTIHGYGYKLEV